MVDLNCGVGDHIMRLFNRLRSLSAGVGISAAAVATATALGKRDREFTYCDSKASTGVAQQVFSWGKVRT